MGVLSVSQDEWHAECSKPRLSAADAIWVRDGCFIHPELVAGASSMGRERRVGKSAHCLFNFQLHHGLHLSFVFVDYILPSFMFLCEHWNSTEHKRGWVLKFPSLHPDSASAWTSKSVVRADTGSTVWQTIRQPSLLSHIRHRYTPDCVSRVRIFLTHRLSLIRLEDELHIATKHHRQCCLVKLKPHSPVSPHYHVLI